jgi:hypothetical protein
VDGSDFAALTRTSCERSIEMHQQPEELAKSKTESRIPLTSRPVGSISRSHRDQSLRADLGSMALRARVAAYSRRRGLYSVRDLASAMGSAASVILKMRSGLSIRGRSAGGGGRRGRPPQSAHGPPDPSARPEASPTDPGAGVVSVF